jgi:putative phage-type endonuclease
MKKYDNQVYSNVIEILNFFGYNNQSLTSKEYTNLKDSILLMYHTLYDKELDPKIINNIFNCTYDIKTKYCIKNNPYNVAVNSDTSCDFVNQEIDINGNNMVPKYMEVSDDENIINISLDLIDSYNNTVEPIKLDNMLTVTQRDEHYENLIDKIKIDLVKDLKRKTDHYDYLRNLPQPVQKSKEWFELRDGMITASSAAEILGESKYGTRDEMLLDKVGILPNKYKENMFVHHGKKYELIATMIYEYLYNTKVGEFGLVPYQNDNSDLINVNFMGASPDGISTCITLDGKPNPMVGRMLEIKCPLKRKILTVGEIDGEICPHYYWVQVQMQLACCKNEECDFWQCNIQEYSDDEWLLDNTEDEKIFCKFTVEQNISKKINSKLAKGCIIQLLPKDKSKIPKGDRWEWYAKYIYPSNLLMSDDDYIAWTKHIEKNWKTLYPEYVNDYYLDKVLYWKLHNCHNVLIKRDIEWFRSKLPKFQEFWKEVLHLRKNKDEANKLLEKFLSKKTTKEPKNYTSTYKSTKTNNKNNDDLFLSNSEENKNNYQDDDNLFLTSSEESNNQKKIVKTTKNTKNTKTTKNTKNTKNTKIINIETVDNTQTKRSKLLDD